MATPTVDLGLLNSFSPIFVFILVFAVCFGIFQWSKLFGDNKVIHAMIAVVIGLFSSVFSTSARGMIEFMVPWFTILIIFGVLLIIIFKMFGVSDSSLTAAAKDKGVMWTILIIAVIIILGALSTVYGQKSLSYTTPGAETSTDTTTTSTNTESRATTVSANTEGVQQTTTQNVGVINPGNPGTSNTGSTNFNQNVGATFYNPRVLGMLFVLLIIALGVRMLTQPPTA
jgi:hypothetical protein